MLVGPAVRRVAIIGGVRIPFARAYTRLRDSQQPGHADRCASRRGRALQARTASGSGDVAAGAVIKHSRDYNLVRESVLSSGLDPQTPGLDMQRACGTSLEAAIDIGNKIALGQIEVGIAGGVDSISDAPIVYPHSYQQLLLRSYRGRSAWQRVSPWLDLRPKHFKPVLAGGGRAAHRAVDGPEHRDHGQALADQPHRAGPARLRQPPEGGGRLARRLLR